MNPRPLTLALFEKRIAGDDALTELARMRFQQAGMGAEMHAATPEQLHWTMRFRPESLPVIVHLPRHFNLTDDASRPVPDMLLARIRIPVLVVHHEMDQCSHCAFAKVPGLMAKLTSSPRKELRSFRGGQSRGDPCEAMAYHGFNGLDREVVEQISAWILAK